MDHLGQVRISLSPLRGCLGMVVVVGQRRDLAAVLGEDPTDRLDAVLVRDLLNLGPILGISLTNSNIL